MTTKLRKLIPESMFDDNPQKITLEDKKKFLEIVSNFNEIGKKVHREVNLKEIAKTLTRVVDIAEHVAINETDDWFDSQTIKRNMIELKKTTASFYKTANEAQVIQERLSSLYDDVGHVLGRYFEIKGTEANNKEQLDEKNEDFWIIAKRNNKWSVFNKKAVTEKEALNFIERLKRAGIASVDKNSILYVDTKELKKVYKLESSKESINEIKFNKNKVQKVINKDKFLKYELQKLSGTEDSKLKTIFDEYIIGFKDMEKKYEKS